MVKEGWGSPGLLAYPKGAVSAGGQWEGEAGITRDWGAEEGFGEWEEEEAEEGHREQEEWGVGW